MALVVWDGGPNGDLRDLHSPKVIDCRAARIIYHLPRDVPTDEYTDIRIGIL